MKKRRDSTWKWCKMTEVFSLKGFDNETTKWEINRLANQGFKSLNQHNYEKIPILPEHSGFKILDE